MNDNVMIKYHPLVRNTFSNNTLPNRLQCLAGLWDVFHWVGLPRMSFRREKMAVPHPCSQKGNLLRSVHSISTSPNGWDSPIFINLWSYTVFPESVRMREAPHHTSHTSPLAIGSGVNRLKFPLFPRTIKKPWTIHYYPSTITLVYPMNNQLIHNAWWSTIQSH